MQYIFILGRNPELSKAEIFSYLYKEGIKTLNWEIKANGLFIELDKNIPDRTIDRLGGTISIGRVISNGSINGVLKELETKNLYLGTSNKLNYLVWDFCGEETEDIRDYLKKRFKEERLKATEKRAGNFMEMQSGESVRNVSHGKLIDVEYFFFKGKEFYFGEIIEKSNYDEIEKRDMNKPFRRSDLAISPRLAKIMINLSRVKNGERLLDIFCGIGVILQEALLQGIKVIGIDKDARAINGAMENLKWGKFNKENYSLINEDSIKISISKVHGVATEPDLGEILKKAPNAEKIRSMLSDYENLMARVLRNIENQVSGRIVFTAPLIKTGKGRVSCNIERILERTRLGVAEGFPIPEYRENQIVGRNIFVLEKR